MAIFDKLKARFSSARRLEEQLYEKVSIEIRNGILSEGLWAKAVSRSNGNEDYAMSLYIKYRAISIRDEYLVKMRDDEIKLRQKEDKKINDFNNKLKACEDLLLNKGSVLIHKTNSWEVHKKDGKILYFNDLDLLEKYSKT